MLRNVPVDDIWLDKMGCFHGKLQSFAGEYILSHVVRMSQKKGEWVTEFTMKEFMEDFNLEPLRGGFKQHFNMLVNQGYLNWNQADNKIKVTKKFAELCAA